MYWGGITLVNQPVNCMLKIVIPNPIQLEIVRAEPTSSFGENAAVNAENCGESATTTIPQKTIAVTNSGN